MSIYLYLRSKMFEEYDMLNAQINKQLYQLIDNCHQIRVYLFEKRAGRIGGYNIYLFPNEPTQEIISDYQSNFIFYVKDKDVVDYSQTESKKDTIQKIACSELPLWEELKNLIDSMPFTNVPIFTIDKISNNIKIIITECILEDQSSVYLISKFSYKAAYGRKIRFALIGNSFKKLNKPVLTLGDAIDSFIYKDTAYILIESHFDTIFDFHKRIKDEVSDKIGLINDWDFFDNNNIKLDIIDKPRKGRQFLKVINSDNLTTWKEKTPSERKALILGNEKLRDKFSFDENDKIIYSKNALNELFKLLTDDYFKSIITDKTEER